MISDLEARKLASEWHGGQSSPLYALSSSGAIVDGCADEILCDINEKLAIGAIEQTDTTDSDLDDLLSYVDHYGPRGPKKGWNLLTW